MTNTATIILFGIPRHPRSFLGSFEENILAPLTDLGLVARVCGQLNLPMHIDNPRSGESGKIQAPEAICRRFPEVVLKDQSDVSIADDIRFYRSFPDRWKDDYRSLRNLLHQQQSLIYGSKEALSKPSKIYIFLRPDLVYIDNFRSIFKSVILHQSPAIFTPAWLTCRGLNDRIAITTSIRSAQIYSSRITLGRRFVAEYGKGLHSERLVAYTLGINRIANRFFEARAARCRIDGSIVNEDFTIKWRVKARTQARLKLAPRSYAN